MGFSVQVGIPAITVFLQGLLSFFSPCVLPLVPLYIGYLAGGTRTVDEQGRVCYSRKKVLVNTLFFIIGVSFAFFLLGFGFTAAGHFFGSNRTLFARIGGVIVILFGLFQLGVFGGSMLEREHRLPFRLDKLAMNPILALVLGFTFSFAWTPCVGPALASVLLMASSAASKGTGFLLIGVYTVGFVIPFLAVGIFTGTVLDFFKKHQNVVKYTTKIGGALMLIMGIMMLTGWLNGITGYLSNFSGQTVKESQAQTGAGGSASGTEAPAPTNHAVDGKKTDGTAGQNGASDQSVAASQNGASDQSAAAGQNGAAGQSEAAASDGSSSQNAADSSQSASDDSAYSLPPADKRMAAPDFTLVDQYGVSHTLSDYKGKVVLLNFWATWCPPCRKEMPDIESLYKEYGKNSKDLVILSVANPKTKDHPNNIDDTMEAVTKFMKDNGYSYPALMDTTGNVLLQYYVTAFPTTFMIDKEGRTIGYATGALTKDIFKNIITQALAEGAE